MKQFKRKKSGFPSSKKYLDEDTNTFEAERKVGSKIVWHF